MTLVFVYGTLRHGWGNHGLLVRGSAEYIGTARLTGVDMRDLGSFPCIHRAEPGEEGTGAVGEVYRVDDATLASLDRLEGAPTFYHRARVEVLMDSGQPLICEAYFLSKPSTAPLISDGDWSSKYWEPTPCDADEPAF